jgi:predicted DCC family thiol-disulfide oxidoreductase YuxK
MTSCIPLSVGAAGYGDLVAGLTVLYDEGCGFCTKLAAWLARRRGLRAAAIGSGTGSYLLRDLTPAERYAEVHVVDAVGRRRSGGAALAPLLRALPGGSAPAALCDAFPGLTAHAYHLAAGNRGAALRMLGTPRRVGRRQVAAPGRASRWR